jgi:transcription elongation factor GreA
MNKIPMTVVGAAQLQTELEELKRNKPQITAAIAEARAHGDLKENAEYHAAREQQGLAEARIRDIEHKLQYAHVIDVTKMSPQNRVIFGVTVHLFDFAKKQEVIYQLVGEDEANITRGKIAVTAPLARALIGKSAGDVVEVKTPSGMIEYEIMKIEHV